MQIIKNIYYFHSFFDNILFFLNWQHTIFTDSNNSFRFGFIQMRVYHPLRVKRKEARNRAEMVSRGLTARFHTRKLSPSVITFYTIFILAFSIFLFLFYVRNFNTDEDQSHPLFSHQSLPQQVCRYSFFCFPLFFRNRIEPNFRDQERIYVFLCWLCDLIHSAVWDPNWILIFCR